MTEPDDPMSDPMFDHYRDELLAEAELARGDLDEIEDHLRSLADDLRDRGMPRAEAIAEACRRLGAPREIAREHARVRAPFGARLSRARAWSVAALLVIPLIYEWPARMRAGVISPSSVDLALWLLAIAGLVTRRGWARPIVLGSMLTTFAFATLDLVIDADAPAIEALAIYAALLAFLAPWSRRELSRSGLALVLLGPAYCAAFSSVVLYMTAPHGVILTNPICMLALAMTMAASAGVVLRARWAGIAAAIAAIALAGFAHEAWSITFRFRDAWVVELQIVGGTLLGSATAAIAAVLAWRGARSPLGTLRDVFA